MNHWAWIITLLFLVVVSCLPHTQNALDSQPQKPEINESLPKTPTPLPKIQVTQPKELATPSPIPEKSACEFEVESLKSEVDSLREKLSSNDCYSSEVYE